MVPNNDVHFAAAQKANAFSAVLIFINTFCLGGGGGHYSSLMKYETLLFLMQDGVAKEFGLNLIFNQSHRNCKSFEQLDGFHFCSLFNIYFASLLFSCLSV